MNKAIIVFLVLFFSCDVSADILGQNIQNNSIIRAADFNQKFNEINSVLSSLGFSQKTFHQFQVGEEIKKNELLTEFYKLTEVYPNQNEINLSDEILSSEINSLFSNTLTQLNNLKLLKPIYYNATCACYKDVPYVSGDTTSWFIDGDTSKVGQRKMDVYLPSSSNGKLILYTHPMTQTKTVETTFEVGLKNQLLSQGYVFVSVEFRHPILEDDQINLSTDQYDIIHALRKIREFYQELNLNSRESISSVSYSKGSLVLANILSTDPILTDSFGQVSFEKMYLLDAQITYNYDTYYTHFIDKSPITIYFSGFPVGTIPASTAYSEINNTAESSFGFSLTTNLNVVDSYRSVTSSSVMSSLSSSLPEIRFGYNRQRDGLLSPADLADSLVPLVINPNEIDYFLHNPESYPLFCPEYNFYSPLSCTGIDNLNFSLSSILNDISNFLNN